MAFRVERRAKSWSATTRKILGWRLSVADNGLGSQGASDDVPHTGLGTSIVEALAHQLDATVRKTSGPEGTVVPISAPYLDMSFSGTKRPQQS